MAEDQKMRATYPYGPWAGTRGFLGRLKDGGVPKRIDNSVMRGMSGSARSEVRVAFRFLGLIAADDAALAPLGELVDAFGTDRWEDVLTTRLFAAYGGMIGNDSEWLDTGTAQQLRDHFKAAGSDSSTLDKSVRFFLAAMNDAGVKLSSYFAKGVTTPRAISTRSPNKAKSKKKPNGGPDGGKHDVTDEKATPGSTRYPFALTGARQAAVILPDTTTVAEWKGISAYVEIMLGAKKGK
ncbi:MAG TPA: hypothetical protein VGL65_13055 [Gemmatimonadales bacterium]|jgi:hypothetical protein